MTGTVTSAGHGAITPRRRLKGRCEGRPEGSRLLPSEVPAAGAQSVNSGSQWLAVWGGRSTHPIAASVIAMSRQTDANDSEEQRDIDTYHQAKRSINNVFSDLEDEFPELFDHNGGATVTGTGGSGRFVRGYWDGEEDVTTTRTETIDMEAPAWKVRAFRDRFEDIGAEVDIDVSGSTSRGVPLRKDGRIVGAKSMPDLDPDEDVTHTGVVTVTLDVTDDMQGIPSDLIYEGCIVTDPEDAEKRGKVESVTADKALVDWQPRTNDPDTKVYRPIEQFALISQPEGN